MIHLNMDKQQIITFVTLAREQNFKRAARVLGVSQPTVTLRIKELEKNLGTELVQRNGPAVRLTLNGQVAYEYMESILDFIQTGKDHISSLPTAKSRFVISAIPSFSTYVFPLLLNSKQVVEEFELIIQTGSSSEVLSSILDGMTKIGILRGPVKHPKIESQFLYDEKILLALSPQHPLNRKKKIFFEDITQENFITYSRRFWSFVDTKMVEHGDQLKSNINVDSEVTAKRLVSAGLGISFLPELSICKEGEEGTIVPRKVLDFNLNREAYLVFLKEENLDIINKFFEWVQKSVQSVQIAKKKF